MPRRSHPPVSSHAVPSQTGASDALAAFRARLKTGRYSVVVGRALRRALRDAAADPGLDAEVGALRLALARLLTEERDPARLAVGVSRLAGVAVQAARLRHDPDSELNELRAILARELDAYEAELAAAEIPLPARKAGRPLDGGWGEGS